MRDLLFAAVSIPLGLLYVFFSGHMARANSRFNEILFKRPLSERNVKALAVANVALGLLLVGLGILALT